VDDANANNSNDESYDPDDDSDSDDGDDYPTDVDDIPIAGVDDNEDDDDEATNKANENEATNKANKNEANDEATNGDASNAQGNNEQIGSVEIDPPEDDNDNGEIKQVEGNNNQPIKPDDNMLANKMEVKYRVHHTGRHALQPRRPCGHGHLHTTLESTVMTQHSIYEEGSKNGWQSRHHSHTKGAQAAPQSKSTGAHKCKNDVSNGKEKCIAILDVLEKKRTGVIKGRGCADRRKQREYLAKEDASAPTPGCEWAFHSYCYDLGVLRKNILGHFNAVIWKSPS
jgi:hypothetical protein